MFRCSPIRRVVGVSIAVAMFLLAGTILAVGDVTFLRVGSGDTEWVLRSRDGAVQWARQWPWDLSQTVVDAEVERWKMSLLLLAGAASIGSMTCSKARARNTGHVENDQESNR